MSEMKIIKSKIISSPHGFSTRNGGVSSGIYNSLNLGMNRGDDSEKVTENWNIFLKECGINETSFVCGAQVHGNKVLVVTKDDTREAYGKYSEEYINLLKDKNIPLSPDNLLEADGYVTNKPGVPIAVFTADCTPLLMEDPVNKVIAAVHCGWRSTAQDIMENAVNAMVMLGADINEIRASIGPAICKECFEVGKEVVDAMENLLSKGEKNYQDNFFMVNPTNSEKYLLDLKKVVALRLSQLGLKKENIEDLNECTMCHPEKYWSHRITGLERGSQANVISLS